MWDYSGSRVPGVASLIGEDKVVAIFSGWDVMLKNFLIVFATLAALAGRADAQEVQGIAAVVNDDIISVRDLQERMQLVVSSSNIPNQPEVLRRVAPQVLRVMIDEIIKYQEAKTAGIDITQADVDDAMADIERQNNVPPGQIDVFLQRSGIPKNALAEKLKRELAWGRYVTRRLRSQVRVSEEEIDEALQRIESSKGETELNLAEIVLPLDTGGQVAEARALASRLIEQFRGGADFSALAENFSQSPSAVVGGDLGWMSAQQLDNEVFDALKSMDKGAIAGPIESPMGLSIYLLKDKRISQGLTGPEVTVELTQLVVPVAPNAGHVALSEATAKARQLVANVSGCSAFRRAAAQSGSPLSGDLGEVKMSGLPQDVQGVVGRLAENQPSAPIATANGPTVFMVCRRSGGADAAALRAQVRTMLVREKLELVVRRTVRNSRRTAFVEIRI